MKGAIGIEIWKCYSRRFIKVTNLTSESKSGDSRIASKHCSTLNQNEMYF